ncbi:MFS transporter [Komagataeibacter europaeus]|uniref:MFS transporter n=1 Tax=Komagataeibacter europaeus TaxID=33995 RepID=UPI000B3E462B|nr:MFS transporter [Komagataeibacter europaeus]ARW15922.1 Proline/betaine transporter [Komagataeibacter europaeus]
MQISRSPHRHLILAASIGNLLEWYDFTIYALFARYIGKAVFPVSDGFSQLTQSLLVFGLGTVARPLGAVIMGLYADLHGRRKALSLTCILMGAGAALIVVDPPYAYMGRLSIFVLCCARLLQGICAGGEIGSAAAFLNEQSPVHQRGLSGSYLQATMGFSNMMGAGVATVLTGFLSDTQLYAWGWRLPFAIGLAIIPVGIYLRRSVLTDAPPAGAAPRRKEILRELFTKYRRNIVLAACISILWASAPYSLIIYLPLYMQNSFGVSAHASYVAFMSGNVALVAGSLVAGWLADRIGPWRMLCCSALALAIMPLLITAALPHGPGLAATIAVETGLCGFVALYVGAAPLGIASLFPRHVRASGIAIGYNAAMTVFGGFAPAFLSMMAVRAHMALAPALYVTLTSIPAIVATILAARRFVQPEA